MTAKKPMTELSPSKRKRMPAKPRRDGWNGQEVYADQPIPGFYKRNVRVEGIGWVQIPARIWLISGERDESGDLLEDEVFAAHLGGRTMPAEWLWPCNHPITEDEYNAICERSERWKHLISNS